MVLASGPVEYDPMSSPTLPAQMNAYRRPSLKNVGKDENGRVVQHRHSKEVAHQVAMWVAGGADENFMCMMLNMRPGVLKELYGNELEFGKTAANMNVAGAAYRDALQPGAHAQQKFWLKARAGWKDGESAAGQQMSPLTIVIHD